MSRDIQQPMRGYLVIHVGGYKMVSDSTVHVFMAGSTTVSVPDRLLPAEVYPVGSMGWYEEGWAVGDSSRERFCAWDGPKPKRRFHDYDEAVAYIYRLRQKRKRPNEVYTLVYFTTGAGGKERHRAVSSSDDIAAFEAEVAMENEQYVKDVASREQSYQDEYPEIARLNEVHGIATAHRLAALLKTIRESGPEKAKQSMSRASFHRDVRELRKLGLLS